MWRFIDNDLILWKLREARKPLLLRGARQVGKTHAARKLGKTFSRYVEINFEDIPSARDIFEGDLSPERIIQELSALVGKSIVPGETLLFFDEVQVAPRAITSLRYFYERLPKLHLIAAGSLLDFAIQSEGIPVGRVLSLYMYPMTFIEFLYALGHELLVQQILSHDLSTPMSEPLHKKILELLGRYLAIGGMPEAVLCFKSTGNPLECALVHNALIDTYRQDFGKYAKKFQIKYLQLIFDSVPRQLGNRFRYGEIDGDYRKRELAPSLDLLTTAGIVNKVFHTDAQGIPLGAEINPSYFKVIFIDVALAQAALGLQMKGWILDPFTEFVNKGHIVESFVGQEFLGYSYPHTKARLFYWLRAARNSQAEIDYVIQDEAQIIPVEVKSGKSSALLSMQTFLNTHEHSPFGIRFSPRNYSAHEKVLSMPLYAIISAFKSFAERARNLNIPEDKH
jgi:uncharacterized protein